MSNLFGTPELTRQEKTKKSRKNTSDLTKEVIDYLNKSGLFIVHRSNNIPAPIIKREKKIIKAVDETGKLFDFTYEDVQIMFKAKNIKEKILDISGFTTKLNTRGGGIHLEIEVKTGKDELSEGQIERIKKIKEAGGISFVFSDMETFLHQIKPYMERPLPF
jgi:hypothetical protein